MLKALASLRTCINSSFCSTKKDFTLEQEIINGQNFPTLMGFMQHEMQNSKVAQQPVEFLHSLQLYLKLDEVEFVSQHPLESKLPRLQT